MDQAIIEAKLAGERGEVPVGAVIVCEEVVIARNGNRTIELDDPTAHAEMLVIREAARKQGSQRLNNCDLYVTLEPCTMCAAGISFARIRRLYFGASDPKSGGVENGVCFYSEPSCHHAPECYGGLGETQSSQLLKEFFSAKR